MAEGKKAEELNANQKIALVLAAMGADNASAVYKHLSDDEIEALSTEVAKLEYQPIDVVEGVLNEFYELCLTQKVVTEGGVDYAREILEKAFGTEAANNLLQRITKQLKTKSFDFVRKADYKNLLAIVQNEHPQTIALILSYARIDQAAAILAELPKEKRVEVVERIARMDRASPDVIKALEATLEKKFANLVNTDSMEVGGISYVAEVMNNVDRATEKYIFDELSARDQKLADQIKQKMFVFEDIVNLDSMAIQEFTKQVDPKDLSLSRVPPRKLRSAYSPTFPRVQERAFRQISSTCTTCVCVTLRLHSRTSLRLSAASSRNRSSPSPTAEAETRSLRNAA